MLSAGLAELFGLERSFGLDVVVIVIWGAIFGFSVYSGLEKGIKVLSDINLWLIIFILAFTFLFGPTIFILDTFTNSVGLLIQNFVEMSFYIDPITKGENFIAAAAEGKSYVDAGGTFPEWWTIFYWAWWVAYGPFMGLFVTRISRGRTLRALILGMAGFGTLGCAAFYIVWGNTVLWLDLHGGLGLLDLVRAGEAATAIAVALGALAGQPGPLLLFLILGFVFVATTYDSASYAIAAAATRDLRPGAHPHRAHRLFWAAALAFLPVALIVIGSLEAVRSAVLVVSLPILVIGVLAVVSLLRSLQEREDAA
jgi:BCCT family betaine/carnitine transporter